MRLCLTFSLSLVWLFLIQAPGWSILIETGAKQRVGGYLVSEDAKQITVRIKTPDGKEKVEVYDRAKIKIIHKVDRERLEKLKMDNPNAYRVYAEELAEIKTDPEARELALRLFLITAYLDSPKFGRSCLLSMSTLATRPADVRKYRAMAFLLDSKSDQGLLKAEAVKAVPPTSPESKTPPNALNHFQVALRKYRNGLIGDAKDYAMKDGVGYYFGAAPGMMDQKSFVQACNDAVCSTCKLTKNVKCSVCNGKGKVPDPFGFGGFQACVTCNGKGSQKCSSCNGSGLNPYPEEKLKAVIRAEVWALEQVLPNEPAAKKSASLGWSNAMNSRQMSPIPLLRLETITKYDPRECVFRNGTWQVP